MPKCDHMNFSAEVDVHRLTRDEGGPVTGYMADVRVRCLECGKPFQFLGLPAGVDTQAATVSVDGLEAHLALCPQGHEPSALDRIAANFAPERKH